MSEIRIAINGFGRIGRTLCRVLLNHPRIKIVAVNDVADKATMCHLLKYDSIHGRLPAEIVSTENGFQIADHHIHYSTHQQPRDLPWHTLGVDVCIESTGLFKTGASAREHLDAGARKVIVSAPAEDAAIKTIVLGVNDHTLKSDDLIVSNASCTTNNAAPMIDVIKRHWGIEQAYITTVHSYTTDQRLHDAPHRDWRRARAAAQSIVPTTTGAAKALTRIFQDLDGRLGGAGVRVPVPNGSLTDLTCLTTKRTTAEEINRVFSEEAQSKLRGILAYTADPVVSIDVIGDSHSCLFDSQLTSVLGSMVKVVGWYDNEWGYCSRLSELIERMA